MINTRSRRARLQRAALYFTGAALAVAAGLALAHPAAGAKTAAASDTVVETHKTSEGVALAASNGHTLYLFNHDGLKKSHCSGSCAKTWQPLIASGKVSTKAKSGVKAKLLGTIKRKDGRTQVTYNKFPVYTYVKDKKAGDTKGWAKHSFGGYWWMVTTKGEAIESYNGAPIDCSSPYAQGGYAC